LLPPSAPQHLDEQGNAALSDTQEFGTHLLFRDAPAPALDELSDFASQISELTAVWFATADAHSARAAPWQVKHELSPLQARVSFYSSQPLSLDRFATQEFAQHAMLYRGETHRVMQPPVAIGERFHGTVQIALFCKRPELSEASFESIWRDDHTSVALETQSTVGYTQNRILEKRGSERWVDALVEEYFPPEAGDSVGHFFAAPHNPDKLTLHIERMNTSCARFIDLAGIEVMHLSDVRVR
jgi:hypothetical protein